VHSARTGSLPTKYKPRKPHHETLYRACRASAEIQIHVLSHCKRKSSLTYTVAEAILSEKQILKIIIDRECEWSINKSRVDIQIYNNETRELWLIDIKTPYDTFKILRWSKNNGGF